MSTVMPPAGGASPTGGASRERHGYAIGAVVVGVLGMLAGFVWFGYLVSFACGLVAIGFALAAAGEPSRRIRRLAVLGGVLGVAALALGGYGFATFVDHADEPAAPAAPVPQPEEG